MKKTILLTILASWGMACCFYTAGAEEAPASLSVENSPTRNWPASGSSGQAVEVLVEELFRDPQNEKLSRELYILAKERLEGSYRLQILRFVELLDYNTFLLRRINTLKESSTVLSNYILARISAGSKQERLVLALKEKYQFQLAEEDDGPGFLEGEWQLEQILQGLERRKTNLMQRMSELQAVQRELREAKSSLLAGRIRNEAEVEAGRGGELAAMEQRFEQLNERLGGMQEKVEDLTRKLAAASLEIFEKEKALGDKAERMMSLESELAETNERLLLVQTVIQEKDQEARRLEEMVNELRLAREAGQIKDRGRLDVLEEKFQDLSERYARMEEALETSRYQVRTAAGMLEIYRGRLIETRNQLKAREDQIDQLREKLRFLDAAAGPEAGAIPDEARGLLRGYNHFQQDILGRTKANIRTWNQKQPRGVFSNLSD